MIQNSFGLVSHRLGSWIGRVYLRLFGFRFLHFRTLLQIWQTYGSSPCIADTLLNPNQHSFGCPTCQNVVGAVYRMPANIHLLYIWATSSFCRLNLWIRQHGRSLSTVAHTQNDFLFHLSNLSLLVFELWFTAHSSEVYEYLTCCHWVECGILAGSEDLNLAMKYHICRHLNTFWLLRFCSRSH